MTVGSLPAIVAKSQLQPSAPKKVDPKSGLASELLQAAEKMDRAAGETMKPRHASTARKVSILA